MDVEKNEENGENIKPEEKKEELDPISKAKLESRLERISKKLAATQTELDKMQAYTVFVLVFIPLDVRVPIIVTTTCKLVPTV